MDTARTNAKQRYEETRRKLRRESREKLANNISNDLEQKTGLNIPPAQVRLTNTEKYGYCWLRKPGAEHIFSRRLSRQTLAGYKEICSGVGVDFEAVAAPGVSDQISLENPAIIQPAPQLSVLNGGSEIESIGTPETMSNGAMFELLLTAHQGWVDERAASEKKDCEIRAVQTENERLNVKLRLTTDIMCKSLHALEAIAASLGGLREEITTSIERIVLENPE
ncbi:hypothetical protein V8C37DRAFT_414936 [Trichoderma ceciliae]